MSLSRDFKKRSLFPHPRSNKNKGTGHFWAFGTGPYRLQEPSWENGIRFHAQVHQRATGKSPP